MTDYIYYVKHSNTDDKYKDAVKNRVTAFKNEIKKNKFFLNNFTFHICDSFKTLGNKSKLTKYVSEHSDQFFYIGGMTASFKEGTSDIIIKTSKDSVFNISVDKQISDVTQATMHEIGHQFDDQFGYCDPKLLREVKKLPLWTDDEGTKEQQKLYDTFLKNKDLSDSNEFKKAWKQDVQNLGKSSLSNFLFKHSHIDYYVFDVDITDGVTDDEVEEADSHRNEIFAQLFSYAMGEDDGQKEAIVEKYSNCYRMVKLYIKKYLGIDVKNN